MEGGKFQFGQLIKDKRFWVASFLIGWAAALQGHMMWLQKQDAFKQKFMKSEEEQNNQSIENSSSVNNNLID